MAVQQALDPPNLQRRIRGEFNEMPGLCLTFGQAKRLWGLTTETCARTLSDLMAEGFLRRTPDGVYLRGDGRRQTPAA